jgi:hypothetical protein
METQDTSVNLKTKFLAAKRRRLAEGIPSYLEMIEFAGALLRQSWLILAVPQCTQRLVWDSRGVAFTRAYHPIVASGLILAVFSF